MKSQVTITITKPRVTILLKKKNTYSRIARTLQKKHVIPVAKEYFSPTRKDSPTPTLISKGIQTGSKTCSKPEKNTELTLRRFNIPTSTTYSSERSILNRNFFRPAPCSHTPPRPLPTLASRLNSPKLPEFSTLDYLQKLISSSHSKPSLNTSMSSKNSLQKKNTTERSLRSYHTRPTRRLQIK